MILGGLRVFKTTRHQLQTGDVAPSAQRPQAPVAMCAIGRAVSRVPGTTFGADHRQ